MKVLILQDIAGVKTKSGSNLYARKGQQLTVNNTREDGSLIVAGKEKAGVFILFKADENIKYKIV